VLSDDDVVNSFSCDSSPTTTDSARAVMEARGRNQHVAVMYSDIGEQRRAVRRMTTRVRTTAGLPRRPSRRRTREREGREGKKSNGNGRGRGHDR
jgi:hypothetical protein